MSDTPTDGTELPPAAPRAYGATPNHVDRSGDHTVPLLPPSADDVAQLRRALYAERFPTPQPAVEASRLAALYVERWGLPRAH